MATLRWLDAAVILIYMVAMLLDLGRVDAAIAHDRAAVRLDPDFPDARCNLGSALARADRLDEALEPFNLALTLRSDFSRAHHNLGTVLLQTGRLRGAIAHFESALRIHPSYALARNHLARATQLPSSAPPSKTK